MEEAPKKTYDPNITAPLGGLSGLTAHQAEILTSIILKAIYKSAGKAGLDKLASVGANTGVAIAWSLFKKHFHLGKFINGYKMAKAIVEEDEASLREAIQALIMGGKGSIGHILDALKELDNGEAAREVIKHPDYKRMLGKDS